MKPFHVINGKHACAVAALLAMARFGCASNQPPLEEVEALIAMLDEQQHWLNGRIVTAQIDGWSGRISAPVPSDDDSTQIGASGSNSVVSKLMAQAIESDETYRGQFLYRLARIDTRYCFERFRGTAAESCVPATQLAESIWAYDGANYITVSRDTDGGELYILSPEVKEQRPDPGLLDMCGWWVFGQPDVKLTFAGILRGPSVIVRVEESPEHDDVFSVVCQPKQEVAQTMLEFVCRRVDDHVELAEVHMRVYKSLDRPLTQENLRLWFSMSYGPIRWNQSERVARSATLRWLFVSDPPDSSDWSINRLNICRIDSFDGAAAKETLHPQPSPGAAVTDARYQIGYRDGDSTLNIDGRLLETHEPLHGDVGSRLELWVKKGKWLPVLNPETGQFEQEAEPARDESRDDKR